MKQVSGTSSSQTNKKRTVKAHWIVLVPGCSQMALGLWLLMKLDITPAGTLGKLQTIIDLWAPPFDLTIAIDLVVWLLFLSASYSLAYGVTYMATTKISLRRSHLEWQTGLIHQHASRMQYKDMESVSMYRSWLGAILGYGTVKTWGKGSGSITMEKVTNPKLLLAHVDRKIEESGGGSEGKGRATQKDSAEA